ncbi:MAG TPA: polysaccharide biosynthesis tyrosine autokinase [Kiritimatiellia bacterium]|nr:polysaccharide biosynthesis tyrosine autokinase [Kiritimatiellia bacterium]
MNDTTPYLRTTAPGREEPSRGLPDWREVVTILIERAWIGITVAVLVFLAVYFQAHRQTPYFRSSATLIVEAQIPRILNQPDILAFNTRNLEFFNTHINALHSRRMMERAIEFGGLMDRKDFFPHAPTLAGKAEAASRHVQIRPVERSRMITVVVEHSDPVVAADLANALAYSYIQQDLDNRMTTSMQAVEWLRERSDEFRERLETGMAELQQYREETESVSLEEDQNIVIAKLKTLNNTLTAAQTERIAAESAWQSVQGMVDAGEPLSRIAMLLDDASVRDALGHWNLQRRVVVELQQRYRPGFPELQAALDVEASARETFEEATRSALIGLERRYEMLLARENSLREALREQEQLAFALDRKLVRYNDLKRNILVDQELYQAMISRMKETSLAETLPTEIIRLADEARPARTPFRPNVRQASIRGVGMGIALGLGAIFALYAVDHRFRRNEEVERTLGLPVLGAIPLIQGKTVRDRGLVSHAKSSGEVAETFRSLRATLSMNPIGRDARLLMITSAHAGEGKSLVSLNLAISFAQDQRPTLLVGADMRRPMLQHFFPVDQSKGLAGVLDNSSAWRDVIFPSEIPFLTVMPSGVMPRHPGDILGTPQLAEFFREAATEYERIVIDAPPMLGISDSMVMLPRTDAVLFVVRYGVTHSHSARHAVRQIQESGTPCVGVLMNGVNFSALSNAYYYRNYRSYAYSRDVSATPSPPAG